MKIESLRRVIAISTFFALVSGCQETVLKPTPHQLSVERTKRSVAYLASDQLEGRGPGTGGIDLAADYLADSLQKMGLKPVKGADGYFQHFKMRGESKLDSDTSLKLGSIELELDKDFRPNGITKTGEFSGPITFAGYGITNKEKGYDDYADLDVKGRVVLVMRYEPHEADGSSRFAEKSTSQPATAESNPAPTTSATTAPTTAPTTRRASLGEGMNFFGGDRWSSHSALREKAALAAKNGAAAIVFVNPPNHHGDGDRLERFTRLSRTGADIPVFQITRDAADKLLAAGGLKDLKRLQDTIDAEFLPASANLDDSLVASGKVNVTQLYNPVKNVVAVLPGFGFNADEFIVIGAHYDHLGYGGAGALGMPTSSPTTRQVYNGADDNASGTAAALEIAQRLVDRKSPLPRSVLFIFFSGEEAGLLGSEHFVANPLVPLDKVVAMLNLDMVGRVQKNDVAVGGQDTAARFGSLMKELDQKSPLKFSNMSRNIFGRSDHASFMVKQIPVIFISSGQHVDYHRPSDDADKINYEGLADVVDVGVNLAREWAAMPKQKYIGQAAPRPTTGPATRQGARPQLGVMPAYTEDEKAPPGLKVSGTIPNTAAAAAGLKEGDLITVINGKKVAGAEDLQEHLNGARIGDKWTMTVLRDGKSMQVELTLRPRAADPE